MKPSTKLLLDRIRHFNSHQNFKRVPKAYQRRGSDTRNILARFLREIRHERGSAGCRELVIYLREDYE